MNQNIISWPGWETVRLIGRGSFGAVYEIHRDMFGEIEKAALKVISIPQNDSDIQELYSEGYDEESVTSAFQTHLKKIIAEYSLMRKMNGSANVVNCDDVRYIQHDDGVGWDIYIKMELLTPLTAALPREIPEETAEQVAKDICSALELCRKHNIVHRDIKPQNIFYSDNGDYKLGDFGIAKTVEKTMGGTKTGTYKYMSPEVYNNQPYGTGADIYSLGMVLYWMLNERRLPFLPLPPQKLTPSMDEEARFRRFSGEPLPPPAHGSEGLKAIVLKACAHDPKDRFAHAGEMLEALDALDGRHSAARYVAQQTLVHAEEDDEDSTVVDRRNATEPDAEEKKPPVPVPEEEDEATVLDRGGAGKPDTAARDQEEEQRRLEQARLARERAEQERRAKEKEELQRILQERAEAERKAKAEAERKAREKAEAERRAREQIDAAMEANWRKSEEASRRHQQESVLQQKDTQKTTQKGKGKGLLVFILLVMTIGCLAFLFLRPRDSRPGGNVSQGSTGQTQNGSTGAMDITLKIWTSSDDQRDQNAWLIQMERLFQFEHPEYNITWVNEVCSEDTAATLVAADPVNAPDVYMFSNDGLGKLVDAGALIKLGGSYLEQVQKDFSAAYVNSVTSTDGGVYGFPMTPNTWFMYYNKSILSEQDVKSLEACLTKGEVAFPVNNSWYLPAFFFANGCTLFGEGGNEPAAGVQLGGETGYQAALRVVELVNEVPNFKIDENYYGYNGLKNGSVAAYFSGSWDYIELHKALGEDLGACALPTVMINGQAKQLKAYAGTKAVGVNPNTQYQKAAMEFASFLASYDSQLQRFYLRGITPALTALADHEAVRKSIVTLAEMETMRYAAFPQPNIREMDYVWGPMATFGTGIVDGTVQKNNVKEFLDEMVTAAG